MPTSHKQSPGGPAGNAATPRQFRIAVATVATVLGFIVAALWGGARYPIVAAVLVGPYGICTVLWLAVAAAALGVFSGSGRRSSS